MIAILLVLIFLAPTIQYRLEVAFLSITVAEILILMAVGIFVLMQISRRKLVALKDPVIYLLLFITLWAFFFRPWASNWQNGLSDVRDWVIPLLGFIALVTAVRDGWRKWTLLFFFLAIGFALIGIYQHVTDSFRPFITETAAIKRSFEITADGSRLEIASFAVGFMNHPNQFAMYLFPAILIGIAWIIDNAKYWVLKLILLMPVVLALYWTFAKASLLIMIAALGFFALIFLVKSTKILISILVFAGLAGLVGLIIITDYVPAAYLKTLYWRTGLWEIAGQIILERPTILLVGNGMDIFAQVAYWPQPHNVYVYMLLQYGFFGLMWLFLFFIYICYRGWMLRKAGYMFQEPLLVALWVSLLSYFAIGFMESNLLGVESRMLFFLILACFIGLSREVTNSKNHLSEERERVLYVR